VLGAAILLAGCDSGGVDASPMPVASSADSGASATADGGRGEREALTDDEVAAARDLVPRVVVALDSVRSRGAVTPDAVARALEEEGLSDVQTREETGRLLFGAAAPEGGCMYGELRTQSVQVEVGGAVPGSGCVPEG
jgi:hypothetical protein